MIRTVIIEDEHKISESLNYLLKKYASDIRVEASADNFEDGFELIKEQHPDLIIIDIQLNSQEGTGIDLINSLDLKETAIIFISGYKDYAVDAFRLKALDYLLKPIRIHQLIEALDKVRNYLASSAGKHTHSSEAKTDSFHIPTQNSVVIIRFSDIVRCEADGAYTHFYIKGRQERLTSSINIGQVEQKLNNNFMRVHKSHIIHKKYIESYSKGEGLIVKMVDQNFVPVSRSHKDLFFQWLG